VRQANSRLGRYEGVTAALHPGRDFRREGKPLPGRVEIAHAALVDPTETRAVHLARGKRQQTMVNVARDPLEREHRYGRLDGFQYAAGMRYREIMERAHGVGAPSDDGLRSSQRDSNEYRIARMLDAAHAAIEVRAVAIRYCGPRGEFILTAVLGDDHTFRETANLIGSEPGADKMWKRQVGASRVAREFRDALQVLSDRWYRAGS